MALPGESAQEKGPGPGAAVQDTGQKDIFPVIIASRIKTLQGMVSF